ncbi:SorU family sulfite dehydrogenase c-type cytochrome subunit [Noviherbaspirillum aerium]|uniref:SorU family sulfite dehydrogenase c-type cytochrome subunit n=1 Tax=Noviherbaspirillum aerium TaxID=2588497 RepID=UPI00124E05DD|nr:cytochrome c [Noviherbaspirillum aerium]
MPYLSLNPIAGVALLAALAAYPALAQNRLEAGRQLFNQAAVPACALCHTLKDANAAGEIGPNLDELKPDASRVEKAVRNGIGQMPPFKDLSDAQIKALGEYVAAATSGAK